MATQAAYQQLQPFQSGISRDLQFWAQDEGNKRRDKLAQDSFDYQKQRDAKKDKDALYDKYIKPVNAYDTKSSSLNEAVQRITLAAQDRIPDLLKTLESDTSTQQEKIKARINLEKIQALPQKLKLTTDYYTTQFDAYDKAKEAGQWWDNPDFEKFRAEGFKGIEFGLDDDFEPIVAMRDLDADGVLDVQTFDKIRQGEPQWDFMPKFNEEQHAMALAEKISKKETDIQTGFTTKTSKGADINALDYAVERIYQNSDGTLTPAAKSSLKKAGLEATPENLAKIKDEFKRLTTSFVDTQEGVDIDQAGITARNKEGRLSGGGKDGAGKDVILPSIKDGQGNEYSNATVLGSSIKNGKVVLELSVPKTKSITETEYKKLDQAVTEARKSGNAEAIEKAEGRLAQAELLESGGAKVTYPGQNERKTMTVQEADEDWLLEKLGLSKEDLPEKTAGSQGGGMSEEELIQLAKQAKEAGENKRRTRQ